MCCRSKRYGVCTGRTIVSCRAGFPAELGKRKTSSSQAITSVLVSQALRLENACISLDTVSVHWPGDLSSDHSSDDEETGDGQSRVLSGPPLSPAAITLEVCAEIHITVAYTARCSPGAHTCPTMPHYALSCQATVLKANLCRAKR